MKNDNRPDLLKPYGPDPRAVDNFDQMHPTRIGLLKGLIHRPLWGMLLATGLGLNWPTVTYAGDVFDPTSTPVKIRLTGARATAGGSDNNHDTFVFEPPSGYVILDAKIIEIAVNGDHGASLQLTAKNSDYASEDKWKTVDNEVRNAALSTGDSDYSLKTNQSLDSLYERSTKFRSRNNHLAVQWYAHSTVDLGGAHPATEAFDVEVRMVRILTDSDLEQLRLKYLDAISKKQTPESVWPSEPTDVVVLRGLVGTYYWANRLAHLSILNEQNRSLRLSFPDTFPWGLAHKSIIAKLSDDDEIVFDAPDGTQLAATLETTASGEKVIWFDANQGWTKLRPLNDEAKTVISGVSGSYNWASKHGNIQVVDLATGVVRLTFMDGFPWGFSNQEVEGTFISANQFLITSPTGEAFAPTLAEGPDGRRLIRFDPDQIWTRD